MTKVFILETTSILHEEQFKDIIGKQLPQQTSITHNTFTEIDFKVENHSKASQTSQVESNNKSPYASKISNEEDILIDTDIFSGILIEFGIEIKKSKPIGKGNFGAVYKGFRKEKSVAIKILHSNNDQATKELLKEVAILR